MMRGLSAGPTDDQTCRQPDLSSNTTKQNPVGRCGTGGVLGLGPAVPYRSLVGENDEPGDGRDLSRSPQLR
jgi:hypothetical protein